MTKSEERVIRFLKAKPGYLKKGNDRLALILGTSPSIVKSAKNSLKTKNVEIVDIVEEKPKFKRLFFDIETSYNKVASWNIGYNLNLSHDMILEERGIICICYKWEGESKVHSLEWNKGDDKQLLLDFMKILNSASEIVGHNSDNYDIKWIRARCLFHRIPMFPDYTSVDTLKIAKQFRLNSKRLDYIGQFLGVGKKIKTGGLDLWKAIVEKNDPLAMNNMIVYCKQDVLLLEKVFKVLKLYSKPKMHVGVYLGKTKDTCPECGGNHIIDVGKLVTSAGTIKRRKQCLDCGKYHYISNTLYKKQLKQ